MYATKHLENPLLKFWVDKSSNDFRRILLVLCDPYVSLRMYTLKQMFRYVINIHKDKTQGHRHGFLGKGGS